MDDVQPTIKLELEPLFLTCENVAKLLQVPEGTVETLHRDGKLKGFNVGKHRRWWPEHVRQFAEQCASDRVT